LKSKIEFYQAFYERLAKQGIEARKSTSADYLADIWHKGQNIAFFTKADAIEKNPFIEVDEKLMEAVHETARNTALRCGICSEKPYDEDKNEKLPNGTYKLAGYNGTVMACKHHHLFDYVFSTYKQPTETSQPVQRQYFYNKTEAMQDFAIRSGLVDERQFFTDEDMTAIHLGLVKMRVMPGNDLFAHEIEALDGVVEKIEGILPELASLDVHFDYENEFGSALSEEVEQ
jgi:hypothetical protein